MVMDKVSKISQVVLEIFRATLQGSLSKEFFIEELKNTRSLSLRERELLEEKILDGILNLGSEWLAINFPSLSVMEPCRCSGRNCNGWRLKERGVVAEKEPNEKLHKRSTNV